MGEPDHFPWRTMAVAIIVIGAVVAAAVVVLWP